MSDVDHNLEAYETKPHSSSPLSAATTTTSTSTTSSNHTAAVEVEPMTHPIDLTMALKDDTRPELRISTPLSVVTQELGAQDASQISVSSLRQLALSTMRTKRKRDSTDVPAAQQHTHRLPPRPAPTSLVLDYGSETLEKDKSVNLIKTEEDEEDRSVLQDKEAREEGEISEEEDNHPPPSLKVQASESLLPGADSSAVRASYTPASISAVSKSSPTWANGSTKNSGPIVGQQKNTWNEWVPSPNHVRPGLKMNMEEFNIVKELILDILGWGVAPEYLMDYGLSREAIFYTFTELNLRLPSNLDAPTAVDSPHPIAAGFSRGDLDRRPSLSHALPPKPAVSTLSPNAPTFLPSDGPISTPNLSDMEAQRRQELQARKAASTSHRLKGANAPAESAREPSPSVNGALGISSVEPLQLAPSEAVDTFLNNMLGNSVASPIVSGTSKSSKEDDSMDIDQKDEQLGLGSVYSSEERVITSIVERRGSENSSQSTHQIPGSVASLPSRRSSTPSSVTSFPPTNGKRGVRRPVAMDFVDEGPFFTGITAPASFPRRKPSLFAGFNAHVSRKCVIDLSDSEDEREDIDDDDSATLTTMVRRVPSERRSVTPATRPPSIQPPTSVISGVTTPTSDLTPGALLEKEEQIRRMKELIQKREQERLRRIAQKARTPTGSPSVLTPPSPSNAESITEQPQSRSGTPNVTLGSPGIRQESPGRAPVPHSTHSSSTSDDQAEEDVVMQSLAANGSSESLVETIGLADQGNKKEIDEHDGDITTMTEEVPLKNNRASTSLGSSCVGSSSQGDNSTTHFSSYSSPLSSYPLLQKRSMSSQNDGNDTPRSPPDPRSVVLLASPGLTSTQLPNLRPLKVALASRALGKDSFICQYEVPGGGICRDKTCTDLHLSDLEPSDHETAQYLSDLMPHVLSKFSVANIEEQLQRTRQSLLNSGGARGAVVWEDVVHGAVTALVQSLS